MQVTREALPSRSKVITGAILKIKLVNGAAKDASSVLRATPTSAFLKAQVSLVPSPVKQIKFVGFCFNYRTKFPLSFGFILA